MPTFAPEILARWTAGRWTRSPAGPVSGFSADSRQIKPGEMFIAMRTALRDGHQFLGAARSAGAAAALVSRPDPSDPLPQLVVADPLASFQAVARRHRREFPGPVVGISGTAGKTSTKDLLATLLGGRVLATEGNLNNHLGVPLTLTRLDRRLHDFAVVEAGISAPGEMAPLAAMIEPDIAIITLVGPAHLAELGDVEGVAREKAALPAAVRPGGVAIFPQSCVRFAAFRDLKVPTLAVGPAPAQVGFSATRRTDSTEVILSGGLPETGIFKMGPATAGMAQNAALALAAALRLGVPAEQLRGRLAGWKPPALRGEWREEAGRLLFIDCYNANPPAMADSLDGFEQAAPPALPRLFILGGMEELGPEAGRYHEELGRRMRMREGDFLVLVGGNAPSVRTGAVAAGAPPESIFIAASIEEIRPRLRAFRGAVFIKGSRRYGLESLVGGAAH